MIEHCSLDLTAGAVEFGPAIAMAEDGFEVLLPGERIAFGVTDDGAAEGSGEVSGAEAAIAEVSGE